MIRFFYSCTSLVLLSLVGSVSAQDFTTQDPRYTTTPPQYTTTPPQYTTTPPQYTTTPPQYTTTPPAYVPQADTVPSNNPTQPSNPSFPNNPNIPSNISNRVNGLGSGNGSTTGSTMFMPSQLNGNNTSTTPSSQRTISPEVPAASTQPMAEPPTPTEIPADASMSTTPVMPTISPSNSDQLIGVFAQIVLGLDEDNTQQFVSDYDEVVAQLELQPGEVSASVSVRIVLYLTLKHLLGLSGMPMDTGGEV